MMAPQTLQLGASPMSIMLDKASAAWMEPVLSSRLSARGEGEVGSRPMLDVPSGRAAQDLGRRLSKSICCCPLRKRIWSQRNM